MVTPLQRLRAVRTLRDPTRGGLATVLNELALAAEVGVVLAESALPPGPGGSSPVMSAEGGAGSARWEQRRGGRDIRAVELTP